ncbi:MAG: hypothetical protein ABDH61_05870 [Acidilobaceae archaeon]
MRWQEERVTEGSRAVALVAALLRAVERDAEELDEESVFVSPDPLERPWEQEYCVSGAEWVEDASEELEDLGIEVTVKRCGRGGRRIRELYEALPLLPPRLDRALLKSLARETSRSGVEFMVIYSAGGAAYLLEGEKYEVVVPQLSVPGAVHTHPEGHCGLSRRDVESALYALADLSFFEASATPSCYFYLSRSGFLSVDDFASLLNREAIEPMRLQSARVERVFY